MALLLTASSCNLANKPSFTVKQTNNAMLEQEPIALYKQLSHLKIHTLGKQCIRINKIKALFCINSASA